VVVALNEGVVKLFVVAEALVCKSVPPTNALYHRNVPGVALVAVSETVPLPHRDLLVVVGAAAGEPAFTVAITAVRVALSQLALLVSVT
jgi:hypothetical protein